MGLFDHYFSAEALEKMQKRHRSASDVKVEREIAAQDAMKSDFTLAWRGESDDLPDGYAEEYARYTADASIQVKTSEAMPYGDIRDRHNAQAIAQAAAIKAYLASDHPT